MCAGGNKSGFRCVLEGNTTLGTSRYPVSAHEKMIIRLVFPAAHIFKQQLPTSAHLFWQLQLRIPGVDDDEVFPAFFLNGAVEIADSLQLLNGFFDGTVLFADG